MILSGVLLFKSHRIWSSHRGAVVNESDQEPRGCRFNPWPCSVGWGSGIAMSYGVGRRCSSDPEKLLWLWCRPAATAPIRPLAWEPPYAMSAALKSKKRKNKKVMSCTKSFYYQAVSQGVCLNRNPHWSFLWPRTGLMLFIKTL